MNLLFQKSKDIIVLALFLLTVSFLGLSRGVEAQSASLYFAPSTFNVASGEEFSVKVMLNTAGVEVNAVTSDFTYAPDLLEVVSVDSSNSVFDEVIEENYEESGVIYISMYMTPTELFDGIGEITTINFKALTDTKSELSFTQDVAVTDKNAQDVLGVVEIASINPGTSDESDTSDQTEGTVETGDEREDKLTKYMPIALGVFFLFVIIVVVLLITKKGPKEVSVGQADMPQKPEGPPGQNQV